MNYQLRQYQIDCKKAIKSSYDKGITEQLIVAATGCHAKGTLILMYDGSLKRVEDIIPGENLMGNDSGPRKVLSLYRGQEMMYKIIPIKGEPFEVNESHILSLKKTPTANRYSSFEEIVNISVSDYLLKNKHFKHLYKLYKTGIEFCNNYRLPKLIKPYWLGLWIGDGAYSQPQITNEDPEIISYLEKMRLKNGYSMKKHRRGNGLYNLNISRKHVNQKLFETNEYNEFLKDFRGINGQKQIPIKYCILPYKDRLQLLAGLLDSDGYLFNNGFEFVNKSYSVADSVTYIARSLGLRVIFTKCKKSIVKLNFTGDYFRVQISGNTNIIPCKIKRKQATERKQKKNPLVTGFSIQKLKVDDYFGFEIDGNHLYCMGDFTVTHNTGKRLMAVDLIQHFKRTLFLCHREELIVQAYNEINDIYPMQVGIIKGPVFELDKKIVIGSVQTLYNRLDRINPDTFDLLIIDEVHTFIAQTYLKTVRHFTPKLRTGWTATPKRLDGLSMTNIAQKIVFEYRIENGIKDGWLCEIEAYQIKTSSDLTGIKRTAGDFNQKELSERVDNRHRNALITTKYLQYAKGRQGIAYCVDMNHAYNLRDILREHGINAEAIVSDTTRCPNRRELVERFKRGEIEVLTNCEILTIGFDYPDVGVILMGRPTQSETLYIQTIGRSTRIKSKAYQERFEENKAIILDFVDNTGKLSLINAYELEKGMEIEDRLFLPKEHRDKLIGEREERERRIKIRHEADSRINLLILPEIRAWNSEKRNDPATDKQIKWIKDIGIWQEDVEYTKEMASELIGNRPATEWQIRWLAERKYDVSAGCTLAQYQRVKWIADNKSKYAMTGEEKNKILNQLRQ